jgi:hypothetical protein
LISQSRGLGDVYKRQESEGEGKERHIVIKHAE